MIQTCVETRLLHGMSIGPEITWAGANPIEEGMCLGLEDGSLIFTSQITRRSIHYRQMSPSGEAINGLAWIGPHSLALSTREEVSFFHFRGPQVSSGAFFQGGAHGVIATPSGHFVAPLGPAGLLVVKPTNSDHQEMNVTERNEGQLYFSRMAVVSTVDGKEILVFANRRNGFGTSEFQGHERRRQIHTTRFEGIDVVDVSPIAAHSPAAVAVSMAAEVLWIRDASQHADPIAMRLTGVQGPVYRAVATPRHLFVLSSEALYVWIDLVEHVLFNDKVAADPTPVVIPVQAVGMSLLANDQLLLVMASNSVMSVSIRDASCDSRTDIQPPASPVFTPRLSQQSRFESFSPRWQFSDVEQRLTAVAQ